MGITIQHAQRTALSIADQMKSIGRLFKVMAEDSIRHSDDGSETLESIAHLAVYGEDVVLEYSGEEAQQIVLAKLVEAYPEYAVENTELNN